MAFGAVVGVSWVVLVGPWIAEAGSIGANLAFIVGGLLILPIGFCYGELGKLYPATGGEYVYAYRFLGAPMAFATAWALALLYIAVCAFEAISVPWLVFTLAPGLRGPLIYSVAGESLHLGEVVAAGLATAALGYLQLRGAQAAARLQDILVFGLIAFVLVFAGAGLLSGDVSHLPPYFGRGSAGFIALLLTTPLFFAGFGAVPQALGESSPEALKKAPAVITVVILAAIVFHIIVIVPSALVLTPNEATTSNLPVALAFQRAFHSSGMAAGALAVALIALITTWNAVLFSASRILYALGHGRLGPRFLGRRHARFGTPAMSILVVTACTFAAIPLGKGMLGPVISIGGLSVTLVFLMISICLLRSRLEPNTPGRKSLVLPLVSIVISGVLLGLNLFEMGTKLLKGGATEVIVLGAWVILGGLVWAGSSQGRQSISQRERDALILGPEQVKLI